MQKRFLLVLAALFLGVYLVPLGVQPLALPDETRYAEIPREMLASGDWVVPHIAGLRYFEKPPLGYWLTALSMRAFGENNFAARLPSAVSAGATALVVFLLARGFGGGLAPAGASATVLLTSGMFFVVGAIAILDMPLTLCLTATLALFFAAYREEATRRKALYLALCGAAAGAAFLVKGFLAFAIPGIVAVPFLLWERRTGRLLRLAWLPAAAALIVSAPWAILIHLREPDFWRYFFWEEHIRRFASGNAQHPEPAWYFVGPLLGGMMPWTLLVPAAVLGLRRASLRPSAGSGRSELVAGRDSLTRFALCWAVVPFVFFSASRGKLASYILPCFPPLALLTALGLLRYFEAGGRRALVWGARTLAALMTLAAVATVVCGLGRVKGFPYGEGESWKWALGSAALVAWAALAWLAARRRDAHRAVLLFGAAPLLAVFVGHFIVPRAFEDDRFPARLLTRNAARVAPGAPLFSSSSKLRAVCRYLRRTDVFVLDSYDELCYGLGYDDAKHHALSREDFARYVERCAPDTTITAVCSGRTYRSTLQGIMPAPTLEDEGGGRVLVQYRGGTARAGPPGAEPAPKERP